MLAMEKLSVFLPGTALGDVPETCWREVPARIGELKRCLQDVEAPNVKVVLATARELAASGFAGVEPGIFYFAPFRGLKIHHDGFRVIVTTRSKS